MTISSTTNRKDYTGDGSSTTFSTSWAFYDTSTISVQVVTASSGEAATLVENVNYTISGGSGASGSVDLSGGTSPYGAPPSTENVVILRTEPYTQTDDLQNNDGSDADVVEKRLDKLTMQVQQLKEEIGRSVHLGNIEEATDALTQIPYTRASLYLGFNAEKGLIAVEGTADVSPISSWAATLVDDSSATEARATLNLGPNDIVSFGNTSVKALFLTDTLSPTAIATDQDDYSPSTWAISTDGVLRISASARSNLTGLAARNGGGIFPVSNVGTFPIDFTYEDTNSTAANRFAFACTLGGGQSMLIMYDATSSRWRALNMPEPIGTIKDFAGSTLPDGYLAVDQNVSRTTYAALFNEVGTLWGAGDGATTFGLYVGAGNALVAAGTGTRSADFAAASDVDNSSNSFTVASNDAKWVTGMAVALTTDDTLPSGLSATTYYVIRSDSTTIQLATTLANAQDGTAVTFSDDGTGTHTITHTMTARTAGELLGEESHAQSATELYKHRHTIPASTGNTDGPVQQNTLLVGSGQYTGYTGGNTAMNNMQPSSVVTRGIRYC